MVHKGADKDLFVALMLRVGAEPNPYLEMFWNRFPLKNNRNITNRMTIPGPYEALLPELGISAAFVHYTGSLTEPPCTANATWLVMMEPVYISEGQLNAYRA